MKTKTEAKNTKTIKQLVPVVEMLEEADLVLMKRRDKIKAELKQLDSQLKPRIENTVKRFGVCTVKIGDAQVRLSQSVRASVSWKACAYSLASVEEVEAVTGEFTVESTSYKAQIA